MLAELRAIARTKIALVLILLLAASFTVWGLSDVFIGRQGSGLLDAGKRRLFQQDLERRVDYYLEAQRDNERYTDRRKIAQDGTIRAILDAMATRYSLLDYADDAGISASRGALAKWVTDAGAFSDALSGEFDRTAYAYYLQQVGTSRAGFEAELRDELTMEYIDELPELALVAPKILTRIWVLNFGEKRSFATLVLPPDFGSEASKPSEDLIAAFFADNPARFAPAETRRLAVWSLSREDLLHRITPSDDEIDAYYQTNLGNYAGPETRELVTFSAPERSMVEIVSDKFNVGLTLDDIEDSLEGVSQTSRTISRGEISDDRIVKNAFRLIEGRALTPYQEDGATEWKTMLARKVIPGSTPEFEDIKDKVRDDYIRKKAQSAYETIRFDDVQDMVGGGYRLEEIASEIGGVVSEFAPVTRFGFTVSRKRMPALSTDMVRAGFLLAEGETSELIETDDSIHIVQLLDIGDTVPALDDVRDEVIAAIEEERADTAANLAAENVAGQAEDFASLQSAAHELGLSAHRYEGEIMRRDPDLDPDLLDEIFGLRQGSAAVIDRPTGAKIVVLVEKITPLTDDTVSLAANQRALKGILATEISNAFALEAKDRAELRVNERAFDTYLQALLGEAPPG